MTIPLESGPLLEIVTPPEGWTRPVPAVDPLSAVYFQAAYDGRLLIERCPSCGLRQHYPRGLCQRCGASPDWEVASGLGRIYSFTVVRQAGLPGFSDAVPYVLALVDLDEGPRLMGNVTDCDVDEVQIGAQVQAHMVRIAAGIGLVQWKLAPASP